MHELKLSAQRCNNRENTDMWVDCVYLASFPRYPYAFLFIVSKKVRKGEGEPGNKARVYIWGFLSMLDRVGVSSWVQKVLPYQTMLEKQVHTSLTMYPDLSLKVHAFLFPER